MVTTQREQQKFRKRDPWWSPPGDLLYIPRALDRRRWTKREWKEWEETNHQATAKRQQETKARNDERIFAMVREQRRLKEERQKRSLARMERKAERATRKQKRETDNLRVLDAIESGITMTRQLMSHLHWERRRLRRALKRLMKEGKVNKASAQEYVSTWQSKEVVEEPKPKRKRVRLADVEKPKRKRKHLPKSRNRGT